MPLVTLKCKEWFYTHVWFHELADALPRLLTMNSHELFLDDGTMVDDVQVDVQKFDPLSVNTLDIWVFIVFTESSAVRTEKELKEIASKVEDRISGWLRERIAQSPTALSQPRPMVAIDVFWGPGYGCLIDANGSIYKNW